MVQGMDTHRTYGGWRKTEWASQIKKLKTQKKTEKKKMKREESVTDCFNDQSIKGGLHVWLRTWWLPMVTNGYQWLPMVADGSRVDVNYCFQEVQDSVIDFGTAINYKIKWNLLSAAGSLSLSLSVSLCLSLSLSVSLYFSDQYASMHSVKSEFFHRVIANWLMTSWIDWITERCVCYLFSYSGRLILKKARWMTSALFGFLLMSKNHINWWMAFV